MDTKWTADTVSNVEPVQDDVSKVKKGAKGKVLEKGAKKAQELERTLQKLELVGSPLAGQRPLTGYPLDRPEKVAQWRTYTVSRKLGAGLSCSFTSCVVVFCQMKKEKKFGCTTTHRKYVHLQDGPPMATQSI